MTTSRQNWEGGFRASCRGTTLQRLFHVSLLKVDDEPMAGRDSNTFQGADGRLRMTAFKSGDVALIGAQALRELLGETQQSCHQPPLETFRSPAQGIAPIGCNFSG
jgi:hypothetical protein